MSSQGQQQHIEPVSILKCDIANQPGPSHASNALHITLREDEEDRHTLENIGKYISDGDDDDAVPISGQALELLQTEKTVKAGYLMKKGEKRRNWKRRWFVLRLTKLAMYKDSKEYKLLRIIDMNEIHRVVHVTSEQKYKYMFAISTPRRLYYLQAENANDMYDWIESLQKTKADHMQRTEENDQSSDRPGDARHHVAFAISPSQQQLSHTQCRRPSVAPISPQVQERRSSAASSGVCIGQHPVLPVEIPFATSSINDLQAYSPSRTYPLSPTTDQHQPHFDGLTSSDDDDEDNHVITNRYESHQIQQEENRNRVLMEGYLLKLGRIKGWRKRWFVLRTDALVYYQDDKEYAPHRIIPLVNILDSLEIDPVSRSKQFCFKIIIPKRSYVLCASSEAALESWLNALSVAIRRAKKVQDEQSHPLHKTTTTPPLERIETCTSSLLDNTSHISGISGAGAVGGAGGALPGRTHSHRHTLFSKIEVVPSQF
ncbi:hypothetical protein BX666DRAFT_1995496 [Dichotomocladium elegans]|nr:hypothetical protein BX666DRAFT_1995496 [Dichotomocladium elegans]